MTNSTPKLNDKVERQGSPTTGTKRQHQRTGSLKSSIYFSGGNRQSRNSTGRSSCSPPCLSKSNNVRSSPLRHDSSPRGSPTNSFYAGAKFSEPPSPASLPKPPSHWTTRLMSSCKQSERCCDIANHLKMILNVQA